MRDPLTLGKVCFNAAGGGFKGLAAVLGYLEPFVEKGFWIEHFTGVSVSTLIGAKLSEAKNQSELRQKYREIRLISDAVEARGPESVFKYSKAAVLKHIFSESFLSNDVLRALLKNFDPQKSVDSPMLFNFFVYDNVAQGYKMLSNHDAQFKKNPQLLKEAVIASASLPPAFPPVKVGDDVYSDGDCLHLSHVPECGCNTIFILFSRSRIYRQPVKQDFVAKHLPWLENMYLHYGTAQHAVEDLEVRLLKTRLELSRLKLLVAKTQQGSWLMKKTLKFLGIKIASLFQDVLSPARVVELYVDFPGTSAATLGTSSFAKDDLSKVRKRAAEVMEDKLAELLL